MWFVTIVIRNNPLGWPSIASNWAKYSAWNPFLPTGDDWWHLRGSVNLSRHGFYRCSTETHRAQKVGDILPVVASTFFSMLPMGWCMRGTFSIPFFSLSFFSILWPDNKFFYFCPSLSKLKYKSMSLHYVLLYIFFLQKEELSFSSRGRNLSLSFVSRLYSGILSMVDWDRKCSFPWKSSLYFLTRKISSADQRMTKQSLWLHRRANFFEISYLCISLLLSFFLFGCFIFGTIK